MSEHNHDECCGHDHNCDVEEEVLVFEDEEGNRYLADCILEIDEKTYYLLYSEEQEEEAEVDAVVFRVDLDASGAEILVEVDNDDEMAKIEKVLEELDKEEDNDGEDEEYEDKE
jgi:uncharacterized protein YrzB (UPF0473 family)